MHLCNNLKKSQKEEFISKKDTDESFIFIKKYSNRRLYNCNSSEYIKLDHLKDIISNDKEIRIIEHPDGNDITQPTLIQLLLELNNQDKKIFSANFLIKIISSIDKINSSELSNFLEINLEKFLISKDVKYKKDYNKTDLLELQLEILEIKKQLKSMKYKE